jgi:hypothetical protein
VSAAAKPPHPIAPRKPRASLRDAITKQFFRERLQPVCAKRRPMAGSAKHDFSQHLLKLQPSLTADAAAISMRSRDFEYAGTGF